MVKSRLLIQFILRLHALLCRQGSVFAPTVSG